jgi:hypothetical protein
MPQGGKIAEKTKSERLLALDYLRGYFVLVIIIDHLYQFPSLFALISGEAKLWVTAAEGFVMISGFLIGYVRGFKGLKLPFLVIAKKLFSRAIMLYFWMIIVSMGYLYLEWQHKVPGMPYTDFDPDIVDKDYIGAFWHVIGGQPHAWIHFLYLYAIFLALAVPVVYLLRKRKASVVVVASIVLYIAGLFYDIEWMKWQVIFFMPSVVGFYFEPIRAKWSKFSSRQRSLIKQYTYLIAAITLLASIVATYLPSLLNGATVETIERVFIIEAFSPARVLVAGTWFLALAFLFDRFAAFIKKISHGTLEYVGSHSLTVYIAHGYVICLVNYFLARTVPAWAEIPYHTLLGAIAIVLVYVVIRLPIIRTLLPR